MFDALDWVAPRFEVVQSHLPAWKFVASQTVAGGALHARLLVGRRVRVADLARKAEQLHRALAGASVRLHKNGSLVEEGAGTTRAASLRKVFASDLGLLRCLWWGCGWGRVRFPGHRGRRGRRHCSASGQCAGDAVHGPGLAAPDGVAAGRERVLL